MKVAVFDTREYDKTYLEKENQGFSFDFTFFEPRLTLDTVPLADGFDVVCSFVNDTLDRPTLEALKDKGIGLITQRSAGFNNIDLEAAKELGIQVARVPEYSEYAVAEHALALLLTLNRKIHQAYNRVRELNFSLEGLVGVDVHGKTVGVIGTGRIGAAFLKLMRGFGCQLLAYDIEPDPQLEKELGVRYVGLDELMQQADILSLHVPLNKKTHHILGEKQFALMKPEVMLINTSRGALIDTRELVKALKARRIGAAGLDVYEEEEGVFFHDLSVKGLDDDQLARLLTFPNVLITSHQGFLTREALQQIAATTLENIDQFRRKV